MFLISLPVSFSDSSRTFAAEFRRDLPKGEFSLDIACSGKYKLYVNDAFVAQGPCRGDDAVQYFDTLELTPFLTRSKNLVRVFCQSYPASPASQAERGPVHTMFRPGRPILALGQSAAGAADDWKCRVIPAYSPSRDSFNYTGSGEVWDMTVRPTRFVPCLSLGDAEPNEYGESFFPLLRPRPIPLFTRDRGHFISSPALTVAPHATASVLWETDGLVTANFRALVRASSTASLSFTYSEATFFQEDGNLVKHVRDDRNGEVEGLTDVLKTDHDTLFESFAIRTFRFVKVSVTAGDSPVTVSPLPYIESRYPLSVKADLAFEDERMKKTWDISLKTLQNCMHDSYEDCPYYERLQYTMDTRLEMLYTFACADDDRLAKKAVEDFFLSRTPSGLVCSRYPSATPQIIPGFSLYWILMLEDVTCRSGDKESLRRYITAALDIAEAFRRKIRPDGLVGHMGFWEFADWTPAWNGAHGVPTAHRFGPSILENLLYVYALQSLVRLLDLLGRQDTAREYAGLAQGICDAVNRLAWDEGRQLYREGPSFSQFSCHTQIWATLTGTATSARAKTIMMHALRDQDIVPCSFVMNFYLFRALEKAGLYTETLKAWDAWYDLIPLHLSTVPETPEASPRSDCHAWGALPLYEYVRRLLGVMPSGMGETELLIDPIPVDLPALSGTVGTKFGSVTVSRRTEGDLLRVQVTLPAGCPAFRRDGDKLIPLSGETAYLLPLL